MSHRCFKVNMSVLVSEGLCKLSVLKTLEISQFWMLSVWIQGVSREGHATSEGFQEKSILVALASKCSLACGSNVCFHLLMAFSSVSFPLLVSLPVTGRGAYPNSLCLLILCVFLLYQELNGYRDCAFLLSTVSVNKLLTNIYWKGGQRKEVKQLINNN